MAGQQTLALLVGVRILSPQPFGLTIDYFLLTILRKIENLQSEIDNIKYNLVPSSSGPGRRPLTPVTRVRLPLGLPKFL